MQKDGMADWPLVQAGVDNRMKQIMEGVSNAFEIHDVVVCLTERSFRHDVATILPYKGQRKAEKPYHYDGIRAYLRDRYGASHYGTLEADDLLLMKKRESVYDNTVVASTDKDLRQVPGTYYSWARGAIPERWDYIGESLASQIFWTSVLVGDRVDNILGLFGVGDSNPLVKQLVAKTSYEQCCIVANEYRRRFGDYWVKFFEETVQLLLMVDDPLFKDTPENYSEFVLAQLIGDMEQWIQLVDRGLKPLLETDSSSADQSLTSST